MKILVIPDIHLRWKTAEEIISQVEHDKVVFLGDYFDQFGDTAQENAACAEWLQSHLDDPTRVYLFGNHDISYAYGSKFACSGYANSKAIAIASVMKEDDWKKLKWWHYEDGFLFTHAGFKYGLFKAFCSKQRISAKIGNTRPEHVLKILNASNSWIENDIANGVYSTILAAGTSRGGLNTHGGIIWCDVGEFHPIPNVNQIFGHTPMRGPTVLFTFTGEFHQRHHVYAKDFDTYPVLDRMINSLNYALDTHLRHYAIVENSKVTVHEVFDLLSFNARKA